MSTSHLQCLVALARERDFDAAAASCGLAPEDLQRALRALEAEFGQPLVQRTPAFEGFTRAGERVLSWAQDLLEETDGLRSELRSSRSEAAVAPLLARRSVSPKRLTGPGLAPDDIDLILQAALRAPDHGSLHPWRAIEFREGQREALADLFEAEKRRRDPLASPLDLRRAREHAQRAPTLLAFVVVIRQRSKVPAREQWLAAGAALCNLLNAAHQLGFGAIMLSGERCYDLALLAELGLRPGEYLAGFVSLGRIAEAPPERRDPLPGEVWSCWTPGIGVRRARGERVAGDSVEGLEGEDWNLR